MDNFITRFKESLKASDLKGAKKILAAIPDEPAEVCLDVLNELALAPDTMAWDLLLLLSEIGFKIPDIRERLLQLITDRAHLNFGFLPILYKTCDIQKITESAPLMKHILINETDTGILSETIRAVGKNRIKRLVDEISEYLYYDNQELKTNTVQALERIGSKEALNRLEQAAATIKCDQNILDAIAFLKEKPDKEEKTVLLDAENKDNEKKDTETKEESTLFRDLESMEPDVRFNAFIKVAGMETKNLARLEENLFSNNHDLVINTLGIIRRTIPEHMVGTIYALLSKKELTGSIKFAAYEALGAFPYLESAAPALNGIDDTALHVRMAALDVLNKTPTDFVLAEIKKRIETGRKKGELLAETILDASLSHLIEFLMVSDTFSYIASNYLAKQAPLSSLRGYVDILEKRGLKSTAKKFSQIAEKKAGESRTEAIVVSPSKIVQKVYEKLLYQSGYAPLCLFSPQDAFEKALSKKPGLIISDLFLKDITAMEFASEIRNLYPQKELAFVISTLQQDFIGNGLTPLCSRIGINAIVEFPAKGSQIPSP